MDTEFPRVRGDLSRKIMENPGRWGVILEKNPPWRGGGMDIFWIHTIEYHFRSTELAFAITLDSHCHFENGVGGRRGSTILGSLLCCYVKDVHTCFNRNTKYIKVNVQSYFCCL